MDDGALILSVIGWIGINGVVGYAIGKSKNEIGECVALSIVLGPIGWLIAALSKGNIRKCPFCSEDIKPDAKVCRYCGRDLPEPEPSSTQVRDLPAPTTLTNPFTAGIWVAIGVVILGILIAYAKWAAQSDSNTQPFHGVVETTPGSSPQFVTLRQSISVGTETVPAGTRLELVSKEDSEVHVRYQNVVYGIPISATDLK